MMPATAAGAPETRTLEHEVKAEETLSSVAALYDTVPSELAAFNRLSSRYVYPGMKLKIPPRTPPPPPPPLASRRNTEVEEPEVIDPQFVRLNVKHVASGGRGIVSGGLLLTPKVVMFNPSPHDPLVVESGDGVDPFQLVAPTDLVANFAILKEFVRDRDDEDDEGDEDDDEGDDDVGTESIVFRGQGKSCRRNDEEEEGEEEDLGSVYLRLVMGKPVGKKLPRTAPIISYGEQNLEPRYWFMVRSSKSVGHLLDFILGTYPAYKYGRIDRDELERNGMEVIREGAQVVEAEAGRTCNRATVAKAFLYREKVAVTMTSVEFADISAMVGGRSELVDERQRLWLAREMPPARTDGHDWVLKFTTATDGFNLHSLVRSLSGVCGPVLLLVGDCAGAAFGAFLSSAPNTCSEHFQGTGETFVFTLAPQLKKYPWTGENNYFFRVNAESLIVGSGDGNFALWIDSDLDQGRTQACTTFDSPPLTAGLAGDFTLRVLECWTFEM